MRRSTFASYRAHVRLHIVPRLGATPLEAVDATALNRFYAALLAEGRASGRAGLSPSTVGRVHATLHRALRDAVRWGLLQENPASRANPPRAHAAEMRWWNAGELRAFLS